MGRRYEEFEIEIRSREGEFWEARVLESPTSPACRPADPFDPPFSEADLDKTLKRLTGRIAWESRRQRSPRDAWIEGESPAEVPEFDPKKIGAALFSALFQNNVRERFVASRARLEGLGLNPDERGLRLRISFDRKEDFATVTTLPWEFLHQDGRALALDARTPIVRSVARSYRIEPLRVERLNVLLVISHAGPETLDLDAEAQAIRKALQGNEHISVTVVRADLGELRERLQGETFHILHFMGHGVAPLRPEDDFALLFEGGESGIRVPGYLLAEHIRIPGKPMRLVVLNACWGGAFPRHQGQNPFSGVAAELVRHEVPAVVAMQQPIADDAAIAFSSAFYKSLAQGSPIGAAVTEGRLALRRLSEVEWATPVLYLSDNDDLFEIGPPLGTAPPRTAPAILDNETPLLLEIRTFKNPILAANRKPDYPLDLSQYFEGYKDRYILDPDLWQKEIFPQLEKFLTQFRETRRPLLIDFPAHSTLAFAAGYILENKSGLDITLLQRGRGVEPWRSGAITPETKPLWKEDVSLPRSVECPEVALSLSVTWDIQQDVTDYLDLSKTRVGRQLAVAVPNPSRDSVNGEAHALQLAHSLVKKIRKRSYDERESVLHLFATAPYSLLFFLGQHQKGIGTVQLYEHDPDGFKPIRPGEPATEKPLRYEPSLRLPAL